MPLEKQLLKEMSGCGLVIEMANSYDSRQWTVLTLVPCSDMCSCFLF